ncbi:MAG TPA: hypothetical protein DIT25_04695 [Candidatus Moranbacteria bacterium]|nr:hypothetical protein [Candidatus Moranbacteria bacterium]
MQTVLGQTWEIVNLGNFLPGGFIVWSNPVTGRGDSKAQHYGLGFIDWIKKAMFWKKRIVLRPMGNLKTEFRIAFHSKTHDLCMVSSAVKRVGDGPFMMRMGPEDCDFYVIGNDLVNLECVGYTRGSMKLY